MVSHEETERERESASKPLGQARATTYQAWDVVHNERHFRISQALGLLAFLLPFNKRRGVSDHTWEPALAYTQYGPLHAAPTQYLVAVVEPHK